MADNVVKTKQQTGKLDRIFTALQKHVTDKNIINYNKTIQRFTKFKGNRPITNNEIKKMVADIQQYIDKNPLQAAPNFHGPPPLDATATPAPAPNFHGPPPLDATAKPAKDPDFDKLLDLFDKVVLPPIVKGSSQEKEINQYSAILQAFIETLDDGNPVAAGPL
jgi:hypothetical protein